MTGVQGTTVQGQGDDSAQRDTAVAMALLWIGPLVAFVLALLWGW